MEINYNNKGNLGCALPELLEKFYTAAALKEFAVLFLNPVFPKLAGMDKPRKADLAEAILALEADPVKLSKLIEAFPQHVYATIELLLWTSWMSVEAIESRLGFEIATSVPSTQRLKYGECPLKLLPGLELVAIGERERRFYHSSSDLKKSRYQVQLPPAMRKLLKRGFPQPAHYEWEPIAFTGELSAGLTCYNAEPVIAADLALVGDYLKRGNLKLTKAGKISASSLRTIIGLTAGGEFFPASPLSKKLPELRHSLLLHAILESDSKLGKLLADEPFPAGKVFDLLIPNLLLNGDLLMELLLPHVRPAGTWGTPVQDKAALAELRQLFASLPAGEWVTSTNLLQYPVLREMDLLFIDYLNYRFRPDPKCPGIKQLYYHRSVVDIESDMVADLVQAPLLFGSAFLLAAFGLLEIAYAAPPRHPTWWVNGESFVSPFDGLAALRLTSLGAYAFGQTRQLSIALPEKRRATVHLHPERLIASCHKADPLTLNAMDEFLEKLSPELYRLTPAKLLAGCYSKQDLRGRIDSFRQRIPAEIPELWESAFRGFLEAPEPLACENAYFVYQIAESAELRRLFAEDPLLRQLGLKVEGWRIAATPEELKRIRERLRSLGYLLESDAPAGAKATGKKKVARKKPRKRRWY